MSELNGGAGENESGQRLDRMNAVIQSRITLVVEQGKMYDRRYEQTMTELAKQHAEIQDLITLQKEYRVDIMALFEGNKNLRDSMEKYFTRGGFSFWNKLHCVAANPR
jgi:hypothetical protein